jgi:hypothetical protein
MGPAKGLLIKITTNKTENAGTLAINKLVRMLVRVSNRSSSPSDPPGFAVKNKSEAFTLRDLKKASRSQIQLKFISRILGSKISSSKIFVVKNLCDPPRSLSGEKQKRSFYPP